MSGYEIRPYRQGDEEGILSTYNVVFGENDPDYVPRTMAQWRWAFEHNPAGRRIWVAERDGVIAAQCAALPYRVEIDGRRDIFTQGVDSMVHPDHRRGLRRPGLFVAAAKPFFDRYGGLGGDALHYGWPVEPAWRIGKTFLGYEIVRTQTIHFREPGPGPTELPDGVEELATFDASVEKLWRRCHAQWGASIVRDPAYLNWRFVDNPHFDYSLFGVRRGGELVGTAVFRKADTPRPGSGLVMEWLVPPDEHEAGELLREAILARSRVERVKETMIVLPDWSPWFRIWQEWRWRVYSSDYLLIAIVQDPKYDTWWLRQNWWYQLADLDVI